LDDSQDPVRPVIELLQALLSAPQPPEVPEGLRHLPGLLPLYEQLKEIRELTGDLSQGLLSRDTYQRGQVAESLRQLQQALRDFVWQSQRIAQGSLTERADFSGSFAFAFNAMVEDLQGAQLRGLERERHLKQKNDTLRREVARRRKLEADLRRLARHDALTGMLNRRGFFERAAQEITRSRRYRHALSLLMLDVDHFKAINDRWGHPAGDAALVALTAGCNQLLRGSDLVGRLGGEEFALLLTETPLAGAVVVAERLRQHLAACSFDTSEGPQHFTVSVGVAQWDAAESLDNLVNRVDRALYRAKESGRDRVSVAPEAAPMGSAPLSESPVSEEPHSAPESAVFEARRPGDGPRGAPDYPEPIAARHAPSPTKY